MHAPKLSHHRQARQPVDADLKVSVEIQADAGTVNAEKGWA